MEYTIGKNYYYMRYKLYANIFIFKNLKCIKKNPYDQTVLYFDCEDLIRLNPLRKFKDFGNTSAGTYLILDSWLAQNLKEFNFWDFIKDYKAFKRKIIIKDILE